MSGGDWLISLLVVVGVIYFALGLYLDWSTGDWDLASRRDRKEYYQRVARDRAEADDPPSHDQK